jgi:hypothetical protein
LSSVTSWAKKVSLCCRLHPILPAPSICF